jgi:hypothetical protein
VGDREETTFGGSHDRPRRTSRSPRRQRRPALRQRPAVCRPRSDVARIRAGAHARLSRDDHRSRSATCQLRHRGHRRPRNASPRRRARLQHSRRAGETDQHPDPRPHRAEHRGGQRRLPARGVATARPHAPLSRSSAVHVDRGRGARTRTCGGRARGMGKHPGRSRGQRGGGRARPRCCDPPPSPARGACEAGVASCVAHLVVARLLRRRRHGPVRELDLGRRGG